MKIIEAMKRVKANKEKIADLQNKIGTFCVNMSFETPQYGDKTGDQVKEWLQSAQDTVQENIRLLVAIAKTNAATVVSIKLGDNTVTKSISEWVWRRREYAALDLATWSKLTDRNLKEHQVQTAPGGPTTDVKIIRHYDPALRDKMIAMYRSEKLEIDAALEVANAMTDLVE